jgi:hypothetical protein
MAGDRDKPLWTDVVQTFLIPLSIVAAAYFAFRQLDGVERQLKSSSASAIFDQQLKVNDLFLTDEGAKLLPYFFEGVELPESSPELEIAASVTAGSILDFFSHLQDQEEAGSFEIDSGWRSYMRESFATSPVLCETLSDNLSFYGGEEAELLEFARGQCPQFP